MRNFSKAIAITCAVAFSGAALANGLHEDRSWQFESPSAKYYKLEVEKFRKFLDAGGYKQVYNTNVAGDLNYNIDDQNNFSNCINCSEVNVDGDGNAIGVAQGANDSQQTNGSSEVSVGTSLTADNGSAVGVPIGNQ